MALPNWLTKISGIFSGGGSPINALVDAVAKGIDELNISPEEKMAFKERMVAQADEAAAKAQEQAIQAFQAEAADRADARAMQRETRSWFPVALSCFIVLIWAVWTLYPLVIGPPAWLDPATHAANGKLIDWCLAAVIGYWLGSSANSRRNAETLRQLVSKQS